MQPPKERVEDVRNGAVLVLVSVVVLAVTSSKLGISITGAIAFWGIVLALTATVALFGFIILDR